MPKLKDIFIIVKNNDETIQFHTPVSINADGIFTTTLPRDVVETINRYGRVLATNRNGREGFFSSPTLKGLEDTVKATVNDALSRELTSEEAIIKYQIITKASYVRDTDGTIVPNGLWVNDPKQFNITARWVTGNAHFSNDPVTPTLSVFAKVFLKRVYHYASGLEKTIYEPYYAEKQNGGRINKESSIDWLAEQHGVIGQHPFGHQIDITQMREVPATEKNALFFVTLLKFIYRANELLRDFDNPENILRFVENNTTLEIK